MPRYMVLVSVAGSDRFYLEADDLDEAKELADELLESGEWKSEREDLEYEIADVSEAPHR